MPKPVKTPDPLAYASTDLIAEPKGWLGVAALAMSLVPLSTLCIAGVMLWLHIPPRRFFGDENPAIVLTGATTWLGGAIFGGIACTRKNERRISGMVAVIISVFL